MEIVKDVSENIEEGVNVPFEEISASALRALIEEFVSREWSELTDSGYSLDRKVEQVMQQLKDKRVKIVYDLTSESCNIVPNER
jgi:uncharacterized protein YheU (UPF0270 family)